jgi:callose synthase
MQIAAGNGEQVLSRDVRRLAHNMDFTRLLSWYHTGEQ